MTNAFKYAYPIAGGGEIRVTLRKTGPQKVKLTVEDDGVGWRRDDEPKGTGVGSRIISTLSRALGSAVVYAEASKGRQASLEFEFRRSRAAAGPTRDPQDREIKGYR